VDRLGDLHRQFPGGHQHERHRRPLLHGAPLGGEPFEDRQRERRGLAGAGGGLAEQVVAGHHRRDGFALDRRGLLIPETGQRLEQLRP
jgi:hypothetical protein